MTATTQPQIALTPDASFAPRLIAAGHFLARYGLVFILFAIGALKWTPAEAEGIKPWLSHSPFFSWLYSVTSVQGASIAIGVSEFIVGTLILARRWSPTLAAIGSAGAVVMFLSTLSFLFTTPNQTADVQGFLIKDIFLLGASLWSLGESLQARQGK